MQFKRANAHFHGIPMRHFPTKTGPFSHPKAGPWGVATDVLPGPKKSTFALSESGNGFAERFRHQFLIELSRRTAGMCSLSVQIHISREPPCAAKRRVFPRKTGSLAHPKIHFSQPQARSWGVATDLLPGPKNAPLLCQNPETVLQNDPAVNF